MKKAICIIGLLVLISGCTDKSNNTIEVTPDVSENTETSAPVLIPYVEKEDDEEVSSALSSSITSTANTNETNVEVRDGKITFTTSDGEDLGDLTGLSGIIGLAWHTDCGGNDFFIALHDGGKASYFRFWYGHSEEGEKEAQYHISDLSDIELDEKIIDIYVYDDTSPFTTCGGDTFYYMLESGDIVNSMGEKRSQAHPYYGFFVYGELNESEHSGMAVLFLDEENGSNIKRAKVLYRDMAYEDEELLSYDGNPIIAKKGEAYLDDDVLYVIGSDEKLYVYDLVSDECSVYDAYEIEEYDIEGERYLGPDYVVINTLDQEFILDEVSKVIVH